MSDVVDPNWQDKEAGHLNKPNLIEQLSDAVYREVTEYLEESPGEMTGPIDIGNAGMLAVFTVLGILRVRHLLTEQGLEIIARDMFKPPESLSPAEQQTA